MVSKLPIIFKRTRTPTHLGIDSPHPESRVLCKERRRLLHRSPAADV